MRHPSIPGAAVLWPLTVIVLLLTGTATGITVDGECSSVDPVCIPGGMTTAVHSNAVDIVGGTDNTSTASGRAKGNSYQVDVSVILEEVQFWLNFSTSQTLTYYVFVCPDEFGTYTEVYRDSDPVSGTGAAWYSSGPISVTMEAGNHYIIAVSWDGTVTYYYNTGDSQPTSFGYYTHGYAVGYDPLPSSFQSTSNDQAIYHQSLTTTSVALDNATWGGIKALF